MREALGRLRAAIAKATAQTQNTSPFPLQNRRVITGHASPAMFARTIVCALALARIHPPAGKSSLSFLLSFYFSRYFFFFFHLFDTDSVCHRQTLFHTSSREERHYINRADCVFFFDASRRWIIRYSW